MRRRNFLFQLHKLSSDWSSTFVVFFKQSKTCPDYDDTLALNAKAIEQSRWYLTDITDCYLIDM